MSLVYKSLCREIDQLSVKILRMNEKVITYKIKLEVIMEGGYMNIAKARYIMGNRNVSAVQLPTEATNDFGASSTVCRAEYKGHHIYKIQIRSNLEETVPTKEDEILGEFDIDTSRESKIYDSLSSDSTVTRRKAPLVVKDKDFEQFKGSIENGSIEIASTTSSVTSYVDPIKWFGVLVPQTLRMAQEQFWDALDTIAHIATLQSELHAYIDRCQHLLEVKKVVEIATEPLALDIYADRYYGSAKPPKIEIETGPAEEASVLFPDSKSGGTLSKLSIQGEDVDVKFIDYVTPKYSMSEEGGSEGTPPQAVSTIESDEYQGEG